MTEKKTFVIDEGFPTGVYDIHGKEVKVGNTLRFLRSPAVRGSMTAGIWEATVVYTDGVFTIDCYEGVRQIENPENWNHEHNYIDSRGWCVSVGYGEYGSWNVHRKPLTEIQSGFGWKIEHYEKYYKPLGDKHGHGKRFINVEIING